EPRSDLYSLAATIYQLTTGQRPPNAGLRAAETLSGRPDPLRPANELNPGLPAPLSSCLHRALSLSPEGRPATALAMKQALQEKTGISPVLDARGLSATVLPSTIVRDVSSDHSTLPLAETEVLDAGQVEPPARRSSQSLKTASIISAAALLLVVVAIVLNRQSSIFSGVFSWHGSPTAPPVEANRTVMRYYLDVELPGQQNPTKDVVPFEGRPFRFHFIPSAHGYLYIIAEGAKNALTTYLTGQSIQGS